MASDGAIFAPLNLNHTPSCAPILLYSTAIKLCSLTHLHCVFSTETNFEKKAFLCICHILNCKHIGAMQCVIFELVQSFSAIFWGYKASQIHLSLILAYEMAFISP